MVFVFHRAALKRNAKILMRKHWQQIGLITGMITILYVALIIVSNSTENFNLGDLLLLLLNGPIMISFSVFTLRFLRENTADMSDFFAAFSNFIKWMLAGLWQHLWTILWTFVFIVLGIIKWLSYSQYYFILADYPDADLRQALKTSMKMTKGYKGELWVVVLSFLNWAIIIPGIVGAVYFVLYPWDAILHSNTIAMIFIALIVALYYLFLLPYMMTTFAGIYEYLKEQAIADGVCSPEEFGMLKESPEQKNLFHTAKEEQSSLEQCEQEWAQQITDDAESISWSLLEKQQEE